MSNYRRLISYIYAYEGGVKGKNIGYAKIEVRGDQCRIQVNVKKVYVGSNDIGVYLLSPGTEIMLGKIFIRGGAGEFRASVHSGNVEGSGYSMDQCYGLTVHDVESTWQCYTTIWDDAVTQAAELDTNNMDEDTTGQNTGDVTEKAAELELADVTSENVRAKEVPKKIPVEPDEEERYAARFPVSAEIERELSEEDRRLSNVAPWEPKQAGEGWLPEPAEETILNSMENSAERMVDTSEGMKDYIVELADSVVEESIEGLQETMMEDSILLGEASGDYVDTAAGPAEGDIGSMADTTDGSGETIEDGGMDDMVMGTVMGLAAEAEADSETDFMEGNMPDSITGTATEQTTGPVPQQNQEIHLSSARMMQEAVQQALQALVGGIMTGPEKPLVHEEAKLKQEAPAAPGVPKVAEQIKPEPLPGPEDPAQLEALDRMEKEAASQNLLWSQLGRRYPKVLAFDYENGCEILSIKPQDIGLLPREVWVYGNNSFLLHGYYNYRHLILAKLNNPKGRPRYLLGVPGHYFSNEKYMASMFGFPNFVLAKRQPEADGRYGYWYTDIRL